MDGKDKKNWLRIGSIVAGLGLALTIALLILTGVGPLIAWRRATWTNLRKSFRIPILAAAAAAPTAWLLGYQSTTRLCS